MSSNATSDSSSEYRGGESVTSKLERREVFEASGAGIARVTTSSGDVTIWRVGEQRHRGHLERQGRLVSAHAR